LEQHLHGHEGVQPQKAHAINAAVMALTSDYHLLQTVFVQKPFAEALEALGRE